MSITKKLATDTVAYGVSSILARIINFLFGFLIIKFISPAEFGTYTNFYAYAGFILVVLTHGMETAYFRFVNKEESKETAFSTAFYSILFVVVLFILITYLFQKPIAAYVKEPTFYLQLFVWMMAFDTLAAIPFASLRKQGRPMVFAGLKILNILFFILLNILFFIILPKLNLTLNVTSVSYIFIANLVASILTFIILLFQFRQLKFSIDFSIYKKMLWYAMPIMLVGFAGMINEVLDRIIMTRLLPGSLLENKIQLGIYGFNYKFAMIISMFLQAYRFAAEPLFFKNAEKEDNKQMLAKTMKFYTISVCFIFLTITLFMPLIQFSFSKYSPSSATYFEGVGIVPILLMANIFLGIYFNISTWYKITDKTYVGAFISIVGAAVTIVMNIVLVPKIGYFGGAWATLACYATMLIIGYITEQKYYPIPYDYKRILFYLAIAVGFYFVLQYLILPMQFSLFINTIIAFCFLLLYVFVAYFLEKKKVIA
ncbi:MAG: oligosaccharide flippase family protein [Chitinophagales bacterium]|nr:oligosaccharide flippase family protein [Saprospirales bacterium]MBP6659036.1 oligosaccharide flippase family protein [Chitinophagales bacterium]